MEGKSHHLISREEKTSVKRVKHWRVKWDIGYAALIKYQEGELNTGVKDHEFLKPERFESS